MCCRDLLGLGGVEGGMDDIFPTRIYRGRGSYCGGCTLSPRVVGVCYSKVRGVFSKRRGNRPCFRVIRGKDIIGFAANNVICRGSEVGWVKGCQRIS